MKSPSSRVHSLATALPAHRCSQAEVTRAAETVFGADPRLRVLLSVFAGSGVASRNFVRPIAYYMDPPDFRARNRAYIEESVVLGERCLDLALERGGLERRDLDALVFVTTTGLATPSIDALLLHRMHLREDLERTPLFGIGCAAGAVGLARAADLASARALEKGSARVGLLAVELCSLTFQVRDLTPKNLVGAALFGDGAAAAIVVAGDEPAARRTVPEGSRRPPHGPRVRAHASHTFAGSLDVMGWDFGPEGFELVLSKHLPPLVEREVGPLVEGFLASHGLKLDAIRHLVFHPGGPKVVDAAERALALPEGTLDATRDFLRDHGNLSSASVLFLLESLVASRVPAPGDLGLLVSFGPGFSAELLLLEW